MYQKMFKHPLLENITALCSLQSCQSSKLHHHLPSWEHQAPNQNPAEEQRRMGSQAAPQTSGRDVAETLPLLTRGTNLSGFEKATTVCACSPGKSMPLNHDTAHDRQLLPSEGNSPGMGQWKQLAPSAHTHPDPCPGTGSKPDFPRHWQRQSRRWRHDHFAVPLAGCCCPRQQPTSPMLPAGPVWKSVLRYVFKCLY